MAQKTDLNINPYFDDFDSDKNFYRVLFKPGYPVQARELTTLQSILQNQIESFGSYTFKEGSVVIPGNIVYDGQFYAVKLNTQQLGINISLYIDKFIGKTITGQLSGSTATVQYVSLPNNSNIEYVTIYVKYKNSNSNFDFEQFEDGESLYCDENIIYGNTTINAGTPFASLINLDATSIGSAASIGDGVYFVRGHFAAVSKQTIILDDYTNTPSYRVGLSIQELLVNAKDDESLYDNAKGFTNYAAPGADRLQIKLTLTKKLITDINDTNFIELLRVQDGKIKKIESKTELSRLGDYIAERTYEESGHYALDNFKVSVHNSLNNKLGNDGLFFETQSTDQLNTPSDDLMCVKVSPGEAYVGGYNVETVSNSIIDVEKPRDTLQISNANVSFEMGNLLRVNNVSGSPKQKEKIDLYDQFGGTGNKIGNARVYTFNLTDAAYEGAATNWDLYLYDIQTHTKLTLNTPVAPLGLITSTYIKGKSSGASGYAVDSGTGSTISLRETSGTFSAGEQLIINGIDVSATIESIVVYGTKDIKSTKQTTAVSGFGADFVADSVLDSFNLPNGISNISISGNTLTSSGKTFGGIKEGDIIRYQTGTGDETFNRVTANNTTSLTLTTTTTVSGVRNGSVGVGTFNSVKLGYPTLKNQEKSYLYAQLTESNIESVNLSSSTLKISDQIENQTISGGQLTIDTSSFTSGIVFESFDEERYSVHYSGGGIGTVTSDSFTINNDGSQVTINGLTNGSNAVVNVTLKKSGIQNKIKEYTKSSVLDIVYSKYPQSGSNENSSIDDGLTYNKNYGLRVQDEEISLNWPDVVKVIAVYESLDKNSPILDQIQFFDSSAVSNAIIGENIKSLSSNAVARVISKSGFKLSVVYLNKDRFVAGETVTLEESNGSYPLQLIIKGSYKDITSSYILDKGQKDQYYDYSKIIRNLNTPIPSKKLKVIFDHYTIPSSDDGDVYTVLSYDKERFSEDIPNIGPRQIRSSDTLDFRPRVSQFTATDKSPFDFDSRDFGTLPKFVLKPNESSLIGYTYYLPRIDKVYLDIFGNFIVKKGTSEINPKPPVNSNPDGLMEVGTITLPAYLYDPNDATISLVDNRRYTMRDIGKLEDRIENLERVTSLSLLELNTQTLQVQDAQGNNRFKTGFFVDDFKNNSLINVDVSSIEIDPNSQELTTIISTNTLKGAISPESEITDENLDLSSNFNLLDSNVQKTGNTITLKYESIGWIEQPLATRVENVNPFNVVSYNGNIKLSPSSDTWVRTIRLENSSSTTTRRVANVNLRGQTRTRVSSRDVLISSGNEQYMRSRNTHFYAANLKPLTKFYQFFDGNGSVDYIPKLLEISNSSSLTNYGSIGTFEVGETVIGYDGGNEVISFRLCSGNHKDGPFDSPSKTFTTNPYFSTETLSQSYNQSSKLLNVDTFALSEEAQGKYYGYVKVGVKLVGQNSGAVAYVKDLRLISDSSGDIIGSFFLQNPHTTPAPTVRITTGTKTYRLTSSSTNKTPLPGSKLISSAETTYKSEGRFEVRQQQTTRVVTTFYDPLAQSFSVGGNIEAPTANGQNDDANGAFLTAADLFFANKPSGNDPVRIEIRTVELGTPTRTVIGNPVTLTPSEVNVSTNGETPTRVTFDYPIYLAPGQEYAIVAVAETSNEYEMWIAQMGEETVNTQSLPNSESVIYSKQFALGSLFKSQNGSIWTANQLQDMKFKLYKANFTSSTGTAFFYNPTLDESNGYVEILNNNPITTLPKTLTLGITTTSDSGAIGILTTGRKIAGNNTFTYAYIVGTGGPADNISNTSGGINYGTGTYDLQTTSVTGNGSGLVLNVTGSGGSLSFNSISSAGNGYQVGDVVGVTSSIGRDATFTVSSVVDLDTLYVSGVQGTSDSFVTTGAGLTYYNDSGSTISLPTIEILSSNGGEDLNSGKYISVSHFDHGMYSGTDKVILTDIEPSVSSTVLSSTLSINETTSISVASTSTFTTFEGQTVSPTYLGYVKIGGEIIAYSNVGNGTLTINSRAVEGKAQPHEVGDTVTKYELNGVSLRRINGITHDVSSLGNGIDEYRIAIDMSSNGVDRSTNNNNRPELSFTTQSSVGGNFCKATENIQFNEIVPNYDILTPSSSTSVEASIRTISGRSVNGSETPFIDNGFEFVELNEVNKLNSVRMVASSINETTKLTSLPRNKSFTTGIVLSTTDSNLSPMIYTDTAITEFKLNRLNRPISDYSADNRVNSILFDPHAAVYVSNTVNLSQAATSLKVILGAYRHESADFRVLYSLIRADSSEVAQEFELFPGYDNINIGTDGTITPINPAKNSGNPDTFVPASLENQYLEYEFTADNLDLFTGYTIKIVLSGTDQAHAPKIKDLRTIALR
jgi:hypothetical protein